MFAFQMKDKIIELFNKGKSYKEICTVIGCSKSTVSYHLKNLRNFEIKELENKGYLPYIIKDMGKYNKKFVEKQFASFMKINIVGWTGEGTSSAS